MLTRWRGLLGCFGRDLFAFPRYGFDMGGAPTHTLGKKSCRSTDLVSRWHPLTSRYEVAAHIVAVGF